MLRRLAVLRLTVFAAFSILLLRSAAVQVGTPPDEASASAHGPVPSLSLTLPAVRGRILDREGRPLVENRPRVVVTVAPAALNGRDPAARTVFLARLADVLAAEQVSLEDLRARTTPCQERPEPPCWNGPPAAGIPVAWDVGPQTVLRLVERPEAFPGVSVAFAPSRRPARPYGVNAAHVLGYLGVENDGLVGRAGLERFYDDELAGRPGRRTFAVDALGRLGTVLGEIPPRAGRDLLTALDARLQRVVERELDAAMRRARTRVNPADGRRYRADSGAAVVMEVRTGRVVALAGQPSFDLRLWTDGLTEAEERRLFGDRRAAPLYFRAVQGTYAPGSIIKPVTTAAALRHDYPPSTELPCPDALAVADRTFRNHSSIARASMTFAEALGRSCNTFFARLGVELWRRDGPDASAEPGADWAIAETAAGFGFGRPTGIDLPAESSGRLPPRPRRPGEAALAAIGQGDLTVTPIQVAVAYAALANGGTLWRPRVGRAVLSASGEPVRVIPPERAGRLPLTSEQITFLREALRSTTRSGTAAAAFAGFPLDRIPVAAKTGTAEVAGRQPTSWFASFDDRYVVVMVVAQGGTGAGTSAPSVRRIWEALYGLDGESYGPDGEP